MSADLLLIDNYDSFTFNLAQAFMKLGAKVTVIRNDQITVAEAKALAPTHLCISPGPGRPEDAGVSIAMIEAFMDDIPVLGVCLGHQSLGQLMGGDVIRGPRGPMHGKSSPVYHDGEGLYVGLPNPIEVARYHSLVVRAETMPERLTVSSYTSDGEVMGIRVKDRPVFGVQFHPESVLTPLGEDLLANFLAMEPR